MTVLRPDGVVVPIPLVAEPEVLSRAALAAAAREAQAILSGAVKLARTLLAAGDARDRAALIEPFAGLEAEAMARLFDAPLPVLVAGDPAGQVHVGQQGTARAHGRAHRDGDRMLVVVGEVVQRQRAGEPDSRARERVRRPHHVVRPSPNDERPAARRWRRLPILSQRGPAGPGSDTAEPSRRHTAAGRCSTGPPLCPLSPVPATARPAALPAALPAAVPAVPPAPPRAEHEERQRDEQPDEVPAGE